MRKKWKIKSRRRKAARTTLTTNSAKTPITTPTGTVPTGKTKQNKNFEHEESKTRAKSW